MLILKALSRALKCKNILNHILGHKWEFIVLFTGKENNAFEYLKVTYFSYGNEIDSLAAP